MFNKKHSFFSFFSKSTTNLIHFYALFLFTQLFNLLGIDNASRFNGLLWRIIAPHTKRHPRAIKNISKALPENSLEQNEKIIKEMWSNLGRTFAETLLMPKLLKERSSRFKFDFSPKLKKQIINNNNKSRGAVVVILHQGNWETTGIGIADFPGKATAIYRRLSNPYAEKLLYHIRSLLYPAGLYDTHSSTLRYAIKNLRSGNNFCIAGDLRNKNGLMIDFFNIPAPTSKTPAALAISCNSPIVVLQCIRSSTKPVQFTFKAKLIEYKISEKKHHDVAELTKLITNQIEEYVRDAPEQWMWGNKRWDNKWDN